MKTPPRHPDHPATLDDGVSEILEDVVRRRHAGETLNDESVLAAHPSLRLELKEGLRRLRLLAEARQDASDSQNPDHHSPRGGASFDLWSQGLRVRCPSCRRAFSCADGDDWISLDCPGCGQGIRLTEELAPTPDDDGAIRIAHFELEAKVGQGGFGTVWRARDARLDRIVAVKIPRRGRLMGEPEIESFLHEARVAAQLRHPGIVTVHEIGREHGTVYIVSDFVDGRSLSREGVDHELSIEEVAALLATVCRALHAAHEVGVIHRDLKPQNIMMDLDGRPYITDFGLARRESDEVTASIEGALVGTPAYMPPEQIAGRQWVDRRGDIWSLGVILFELLTGELPFRGQVRMLLRQIVEGPVTPPSRLAPGIPPDLETITLKCLEKDPSLRYRTATDLADDLERFLDGEPIVARPTPSWERAWRWCRRRPLVPSLALSLIGVLAMTGIWAWRDAQRAVDDMDHQLTMRALEANRFAATTVAEAVTSAFEDRFRAIESASTDPSLLQALVAMTPHLGSSVDDIKESQQRLQLQSNLERLASDSQLETFAWFIQGPGGRQLARVPRLDESTIGRNYGHRSYFHGDSVDRVEGQSVLPPSWDGPRLSAVFATERSDRYVLAASNPLRSTEGIPLGVIGVMLEIGAFAELPSSDSADSGESRFAVLIDERTTPPGLILHHPGLSRRSGENRRKLFEEQGEERLCAARIPEEGLTDYHDPLDRLKSAADTRWLASQGGVPLRGRSSGLAVVVQESYQELIGTDVDNLSNRLGRVVWTAVLALVLLLAVLWFVLTRRLSR